ncbi:MAG: transcription antitermination factor NusB [Pirellulaceae bacterium]
MSRRRRAREVVMQLLYRDDLNKIGSPDDDEQFLARRLNNNQQLIRFADNILQGVRQRRDEIDQQLEATTENWRLSRMAATDRNVMRIAAWEILFGDTPNRVAINEAIELAKRYGDARSSQFVNGVLDKLMRDATSSDQRADSADPDRPEVSMDAGQSPEA